MCKAFRQRSIWAMIKLFSLMYDYYFFLPRCLVKNSYYRWYSLFALQSNIDKRNSYEWFGLVFSNLLSRFVYHSIISNWKLLHTCHKSKCKHLLYLESDINHTTKHSVVCKQTTAFVASMSVVLTTNTHTYQSFKLLKSYLFTAISESLLSISFHALH